MARYRSPEYYSWQAARQRCRNPNNKDYPNYGGRGVIFHSEWDDFNKFYLHVGPRPEGHTLDRIDAYGNYEPGNVKWSTISEQNKNQRRYYNSQLTLFLF